MIQLLTRNGENMNRMVICFIFLLCFMISLCGCNGTENSSMMDMADSLSYTTTATLLEHEADTSELSPDTVISIMPKYDSISSEPSYVSSPFESNIDFELLTQIFSMPYSQYAAQEEDFAGINVKYYGTFPESVICYDFVIFESGVKCSAGMSYNDITGQLAQFSQTRNINFTIYNSGPHEYMFYESGNNLRTAVEYFLHYNVDNIQKIYKFCFVFDTKNELSYIQIYYPSFNGIDSMLNRRYFMEYSDICFKHIDDLTTDNLSLLLNTKRSYIYSLYHFSSLELRSRIMDTFYYSSIGASPIVNTTIAYGSLIEGEDWTERLEEYPLFILIDRGRFLGADISSDFPTVCRQWGEPLYEGMYEDIWRDEIVYNYMTYVFENIMVICVGNETNKEDDIIISHCLVLPRENEIFTSDGVYRGGL